MPDQQPVEPRRYPVEPESAKELERRFTYHPPKGDQAQRYQALRAMAMQGARAIVQYTPPSREQSLALSKLEEASMWANAAIARNE